MIEERLRPLVCERFIADEKYRKGHIAVLAAPEGTRILGLHVPEMKRFAKEAVRDGSWRGLAAGFTEILRTEGPTGLSYEERTIWGLILDYIKCPLAERLALIGDFLPAIDSWGICDIFCCNSKWIVKEDREAVWQWICSLFESDEEFVFRTATVLSMSHFLGDGDFRRTFSRIAGAGLQEGEPYYIRMGVAWLLATALARHQEETVRFARSSGLPKDILSLYVRKARESRLTKGVTALSGIPKPADYRCE